MAAPLSRMLLLMATALPVAAAQPATVWKFEVASIKAGTLSPNRGRPTFPRFLPGGRFTMRGLPLRFLIAAAWNVALRPPMLAPVRLFGGPEWVDSFVNFYDIEARAPEGAIPPGLPADIGAQRMRQMLQALLEDRFQLKIHAETRELAVYAVTIAKGGPKLEPAGMGEKDCPLTDDMGAACHTIQDGGGRLRGKAVTVADMLRFVEGWTDRPLVDKTGLSGLFKIDTGAGWRDIPEAVPGTDLGDDTPLFPIWDRLGLKLESRRAAVEVYVIDHIERPSEN
jgi:uncharacterized protein (TIGR03435 family)